VNYLLDTHLLLWSSTNNEKLPLAAAGIIADPENVLWVSVISLWEVAIKSAQRKPDFPYEVGQLRTGLLSNGYEELSMESRHVLELRDLPVLHSDPFDRLLVAQAISEGFTFLTADRKLAQYGRNISLV
jgi:PIN domain nuclease of toxin-antitoxin system